jgi:hypothetical protein
MSEYFDSKHLILGKDIEHFFCYTHLNNLPLSEQSPDKRYCRECFDFLNNEWQLMRDVKKSWSKPEWVPVISSEGDSTAREAANRSVTEAISVILPNNNVTDNLRILHCEVCGEEFTAKRSDARFCSSGCRVKSHRGMRCTQLTTAIPLL